jgi:hypothetical protein
VQAPSRHTYSTKRLRLVLLLLTAVTLPVVVASSFLIYQYLRYSVLVERRLSGEQTAGSRALGLPLDRDDLEQRLEIALLFYVCFRPHDGLKGATPAEAFVGAEPKHLSAVEPPRGRPGEGPAETPFRIEYLDPEQRLPVLKPAA